MTEKIRVVIAEDDVQIAEIQKRFLERIDGVELVGIAHTLEDAEDLVDVFKPELLLLDNHFPNGTGSICCVSCAPITAPPTLSSSQRQKKWIPCATRCVAACSITF